LGQFLVSRLRSFGHAFHGWAYVLRTQRNAWLQLAIAVAVFGLSFWLQLGPLEWAVIVLTTTLVFVAEIINTAIEAVVNLASPTVQPLAKVAKDASAAAVLVTALGAVVVGALILGPLLWQRMLALALR
jgi:diacylglycerol kinase (ATP)